MKRRIKNKIANGEGVPKKIKFNEEVYRYHDKVHGYCKHHYDNTYICLDSEYYLFDILNDEVEIIEKNKEIEKIGNDYYHKTQPEQNQIFQRKINELIDKVNSLENKK